MRATEIREGIYWVGAIDWHIRNFHGYTTNRGATYNAYLILDEKVTLIDTVKEGFSGELLERISDVIDPEDRLYYLKPCGDGPFRSPSRHGAGLPQRDDHHQRAQRIKGPERPLWQFKLQAHEDGGFPQHR